MPLVILPLAASSALVMGGCGTEAESTSATSAAAADSTTAASVAAPSSPASPSGTSGVAVPTTTPTATTTACDPSATLVAMTEGPYYTDGVPSRSTLSDADTVGTPLVLTGTVYDADCQPVAGATMDVWQADGAGEYDNSGYNLRGVLTTDAQGRYTLTTVIPGLYPGRTEHIHLKINAPGGPVYTTQLFFPGSTENEGDRIYDEAMLITVDEDGPDQMLATYNFVMP